MVDVTDTVSYISAIFQARHKCNGPDVWHNRTRRCRMLKRLSSKATANEEARRALRYVEPLSDPRTPLGKRGVSGPRGWAVEKGNLFSILLGADVDRYAYAANLNNNGFLGGRRWCHRD
jgi:hypothetical protein